MSIETTNNFGLSNSAEQALGADREFSISAHDHDAAFRRIVDAALKNLTLAPAERNKDGEVVVYGQFDPTSIETVGEKLGWIKEWMEWLGSDKQDKVLDVSYYRDVVQYVNDAARLVESNTRLLSQLKVPFRQMDDDVMLATWGNPEYYGAVTAATGEKVAIGRYVASETGDDAEVLWNVVHATDAVEGRLRDVYGAGFGFREYVKQLRDRGIVIDAEVDSTELIERMDRLFGNDDTHWSPDMQSATHLEVA